MDNECPTCGADMDTNGRCTVDDQITGDVYDVC